ncbi:centrosomal protein of 120 kDa [Poecilia reticulata]|uniref:centrosomal protein of 120 kDa n=1 Tax=Poecilia reticulata TaxID=8081 RepID=UPI0007E971A3|nr:PREDICTED: centrosomal protein of 120 kDa [Poecilia reticulata]
MAAKSDQLLIVVSILEGRHFPKSPRLSLVVQASFDGEHLETDPVEHREQPQFSTELAWELDRKTLHQHRLQRTPIKLQCFTLDSVSKKKESVGYIVLDLRSVQEARQDPRWHPLLSSKYTKQKAALLVGTLLENDAKAAAASPDKIRAKKAAPRQGSGPAGGALPARLEAELIPDQGYHQVGPAGRCGDMFVLSVTVAFATKLEQLIPSTKKLLAEDSGFFFYYSLLGNDITSEPFHNLLSPDFEPERASVRIRSSTQALQAFLTQQSSLQVHLCCGNRSLGSSDVSLSALAAAATADDLEAKGATVEGAFVLQPPPRSKLPALPAELQPTVGVAVTLRREEPAPQVLRVKDPSRAPPLPPAVAPTQKPAASPPLPPPSFRTESEAESLLEEQELDRKLAAGDEGDAPLRHPEGAASSVSVSAPKVSIPSSAHHYCFSLDLRSLAKLATPHPIAAMLRWAPSLTSTAAGPAPSLTSTAAGPAQVGSQSDQHRRRSCSQSDQYRRRSCSQSDQHRRCCSRVPLVVELWDRGSSSRDQLLGSASIQLHQVLSSEKTRLGPAGDPGWRQTHQDRIPVVHPQRPAERVAELSYVATLQDLGFIKAKEVLVSDSIQDECPAVPKSSSRPAAPKPSLPPPAPQVPGAPPAPQATRDTLEYRAALELEMWKEEQEDLFDDQLKQKELRHMQALADEWRKRDGEREALVKKKELEFNQLEEKLQKTLCDLEKREKQLAEAELQTQRLQRELRAEHDLTQKELQEASRRLQREGDHLVALEREKVRLMEEERGRLLQQMADAEARYQQLQKEFQLYREQQNQRPEFRLQAEVNLLALEKVELERKLESTTKSKLHYKQQWGRALRELARFKQREQENAMARLKKQQAELEAMRLRYLATEEKDAVRQDRQELDDIRNELNRLKKQEEEKLGPAPAEPDSAPSLNLNESAEEHLSRLLEERDTLLRTGVYTHDDRIIAELSRQIQEAMRDRKL